MKKIKLNELLNINFSNYWYIDTPKNFEFNVS